MNFFIHLPFFIFFFYFLGWYSVSCLSNHRVRACQKWKRHHSQSGNQGKDFSIFSTPAWRNYATTEPCGINWSNKYESVWTLCRDLQGFFWYIVVAIIIRISCRDLRGFLELNGLFLKDDSVNIMASKAPAGLSDWSLSVSWSSFYFIFSFFFFLDIDQPFSAQVEQLLLPQDVLWVPLASRWNDHQASGLHCATGAPKVACEDFRSRREGLLLRAPGVLEQDGCPPRPAQGSWFPEVPWGRGCECFLFFPFLQLIFDVLFSLPPLCFRSSMWRKHKALQRLERRSCWRCWGREARETRTLRTRGPLSTCTSETWRIPPRLSPRFTRLEPVSFFFFNPAPLFVQREKFCILSFVTQTSSRPLRRLPPVTAFLLKPPPRTLSLGAIYLFLFLWLIVSFLLLTFLLTFLRPS